MQNLKKKVQFSGCWRNKNTTELNVRCNQKAHHEQHKTNIKGIDIIVTSTKPKNLFRIWQNLLANKEVNSVSTDARNALVSEHVRERKSASALDLLQYFHRLYDAHFCAANARADGSL